MWLLDVGERRRLFEGGTVAVEASTDALIVFARRLRAASSEVCVCLAHKVAPVRRRAARASAGSRPEAPPDTTGTLRLSVNKITKLSNGPAFTSFNQAFTHATNQPPYHLPPRWLH